MIGWKKNTPVVYIRNEFQYIALQNTIINKHKYYYTEFDYLNSSNVEITLLQMDPTPTPGKDF